MKAAVLNKLGTQPIYSDFPEPVIQNDNQLIINVKAVALKNLDKLKTYKDYYANYQATPVVVGTDGVGSLTDGTMVYAHGITGTMAEKALISTNKYTVVPDNLNTAIAAALPNAVLGSAIPLMVRGEMNPRQVILINGATGITGRVAIQIAKHYGASKIIATGRNKETLKILESLGADTTISLNQSEHEIIHQLKEIDKETPIDIIVDYLWGRPAELILESLKNRKGGPIKFITVGDIASGSITLSSGLVRSADLTILGAGFGSLTPDVLKLFRSKFLPEMYSLAAEGKLVIETENRLLKEIDIAWNSQFDGKRVVILI